MQKCQEYHLQTFCIVGVRRNGVIQEEETPLRSVKECCLSVNKHVTAVFRALVCAYMRKLGSVSGGFSSGAPVLCTLQNVPSCNLKGPYPLPPQLTQTKALKRETNLSDEFNGIKIQPGIKLRKKESSF